VNFLRKIPAYILAALAAIGGILLLLVGARRKGEQVGAAKAEARVETDASQEAVQRADAAVVRAIRAEAEARRAAEAAKAPGATEAAKGEALHAAIEAEATKREAQDEAARIRERILRRTQ
jgi:hypothetical protein